VLIESARESALSTRRIDVMEVRMEGKKGTVVSGIDPVLRQIQHRLQARPKEWLKALQENPGKFADLEMEVHRAFAQAFWR
jgi:hypothetical protein